MAGPIDSPKLQSFVFEHCAWQVMAIVYGGGSQWPVGDAQKNK